MTGSVGREFFPTSSSVAAQNSGVHCRACSIKCHQEVPANCVEDSDVWMSTVGCQPGTLHDTSWHRIIIVIISFIFNVNEEISVTLLQEML